MRRPRHVWLALPLLLGLAMPSVPAIAGEPPDLAYLAPDGSEVRTVDAATGTIVHRFDPFQWYSLDGDVFAGSRHTRRSEVIVASDATTGTRLFRIRNAFAPVVLADGRKVGFVPDRFAHRDPYFGSVWLRNAAGRERAVVRFYGPRATTNPRDLEGEGIPLDNAWSRDGSVLAVAFGNDVDLFIYDIWVVDTRTGDARRITRGQASRFPSLSPSGDRLAFLRETARCGGPPPGYRAGDLRVVELADGTRSVLLEGDCDAFYTDPRWISEGELVAARLTLVAPGDYDVDLVRVDAATGAVTDLMTTGDVFGLVVSSDEGLVAYQRAATPDGFEVLDLASGTTTSFTGVYPVLSGAHRQV